MTKIKCTLSALLCNWFLFCFCFVCFFWCYLFAEPQLVQVKKLYLFCCLIVGLFIYLFTFYLFINLFFFFIIYTRKLMQSMYFISLLTHNSRPIDCPLKVCTVLSLSFPFFCSVICPSYVQFLL